LCKWASIYYGTKGSTVGCLRVRWAVHFVSGGAHSQKQFDKMKVDSNDTYCTNKLLKQQKTKFVNYNIFLWDSLAFVYFHITSCDPPGNNNDKDRDVKAVYLGLD
jgi:hypothetical protein